MTRATKRAGEKRKHKLNAGFTIEERRQINAVAKAAGESTADWILRRVREVEDAVLISRVADLEKRQQHVEAVLDTDSDRLDAVEAALSKLAATTLRMKSAGSGEVTYRAQVPISINFTSPFDSHDFRSGFGVEYEAQADLNGTIVSVKLNDRDGSMTVEGLEAESESAASRQAVGLFSLAAQVASLDIQLTNRNAHYGQPSIGWFVRDVEILPRDQWPSDSLAMHMTMRVSAKEFSPRMRASLENPLLGSFLAALDAAVGATNYRSKFYHAFHVIEALERAFAPSGDDVGLLTGDQKRAVCDAVESAVSRFDLEVGAKKRLTSAVADKIASLTRAGRAGTLHRILTENLGILAVQYPGNDNVPIDDTLIRDFIKTRGSLFHQSTARGETQLVEPGLRRIVDLLLIIVAKVIERTLAGEFPCLVDLGDGPRA